VAWSYVFTDLLTGVEKATLPMTGVAFEQIVSNVGQLGGTVPTTDDAVRALDPWAATEPRRTGIYVEWDEQVVWGGTVWGVSQDSETLGLKITAATFDSWLHAYFLAADVDTTGMQLGAPSTMALLLDAIQSQPNGAIANFGVSGVGYPWDVGLGGDGTGEAKVAGNLYAASAVKPLADYLSGWVGAHGIPIEWRVDVAALTGGGYRQTLMVNEATFADGVDPLQLHFPSNLVKWTRERDGSTEANAMYGSASGPNQTQLFSTRTADSLGSDEFAAGYPLQGGTYSVGGTAVTQATLDTRVTAELADRLVQGESLSNLQVLATDPVLTDYAVGTAADIVIVHPALREWPGEKTYDGWRLTGRKVTVGDGGALDTVDLTVVPPADRLPASVGISATLRNLIARVRTLETNS
jgi:hypothetical protein